MVTMDDGVTLYSTVAGLTLVIVGTGRATVNTPGSDVPVWAPAAAGLVTVTV
jgi:hypothetical protein